MHGKNVPTLKVCTKLEIDSVECREKYNATILVWHESCVSNIKKNMKAISELPLPKEGVDLNKVVTKMITSCVLDSIHDGVIVVAMDSTILYANPAYTRSFGVQVSKVLGRKVSEVEPNSHILDVLRTGKPVVDDHTHIVSVGIDIVANITPIYEQGEMTGVVAVFRDATEVLALKDLVTRYHSELLELRTRLLDVEDVVWDSPAMRRVSELAQRVALVDSTVLISGESGTGKEVVAKLIHRVSQRHEGPMVAINCGAIPENLLESELFGYEKGAFTGAGREGKVGLLEVADKGTILLDEIGDLPLSLQVKLLRVIQEQCFMRIGGVKQVKVDVRFVVATNRDLKAMIKQGTFREDLFYRLNVVPIHIPPLRERKRDIAGLVRFFIQKYNDKYHFEKRILTEVVRYFETSYDWPGNVRELENVIERLVVSSRSDVIKLGDEVLSDFFDLQGDQESRVIVSGIMDLKKARELLEQELIQKAAQVYSSTRSSAEALGMDHSTIARKAKKFGIKFRNN
ncbi:MAG: hypothetical protein APF81_08435 [Desulfosporosinus sp. BRH_c37]|nr:MAG: hypothetical protein APF81_08435 [Desulfosporosinus sp. BRH_c37]